MSLGIVKIPLEMQHNLIISLSRKTVIFDKITVKCKMLLVLKSINDIII